MWSALRPAGRRPLIGFAPAAAPLPRPCAWAAHAARFTASGSDKILNLSKEVDSILNSSNNKDRHAFFSEENTAVHKFVSGLSPSSKENIVVDIIREGIHDHEFDNFLKRLPSDDVRAVAIAAMSSTFKQDFKQVFKELDTDKDGLIGMAEFKRYLCGLSSSGALGDAKAPTSRQYALFGLNSAIPFVVFGALDNGIMIVGGDVVDDLIGGYMKLSTLACAAVANTFADVLGISIGNAVEAATAKLGLPGANLSSAQKELPAVRRLGLFASSFGIFVGCIIGMTPLLFREEKNATEAFEAMDTDGSGTISIDEFRKGLDKEPSLIKKD